MNFMMVYIDLGKFKSPEGNAQPSDIFGFFRLVDTLKNRWRGWWVPEWLDRRYPNYAWRPGVTLKLS